jgi:tetratricopeptide (TPR) repeat protein
MHADPIAHLADLPDSRARAAFLRKHPELWTPATIDQLYAGVVRLARIDVMRAGRLARAAAWIADELDDDASRAQSLRAVGHVSAIRGNHAAALESYQAALALFRRRGRQTDVARTLNGMIQSLNPLGRYDEAIAAADEARTIFERLGHPLGLARVDTNAGNICFRQDRIGEALSLYRRAYDQLARVGEPQDVAAALSNLAMAYTSLNDFQKAEQTYEQARAYCEQHDMPLLVVQADFNVAYLYYLRGEYTRALELYQAVQGHSDRLGDVYHSALCDLDSTDIYVELNLSEEAAELAARALGHFDRLGMTYEGAKAVANLALATSRLGDVRRALQLFDLAIQRFARERNQVWLALLNYYQALVLFRHGDHDRARTFCEMAIRRFGAGVAPRKAALCELLLARLELGAGRLDAAERACSGALARLAGAEAPILAYHAQFVLALVLEARGDREAAYEAFRKADGGLELLRTQLHADAMRIAFLEDKTAVYEGLVTTTLALSPARERSETAFSYIEKAKSRSLADLIAFRAAPLPPRVAGPAAEAVRRLREQINWHYRQLELEELRHDAQSSRRTRRLSRRVRTLERQLLASLEDIGRADGEFSQVESGRACTADEIRATLPADTVLLEYYQARGSYYVCVVSRERLDVVRLADALEVRRVLRLLHFQLSRFRFAPLESARTLDTQFQAAAETHLRELHTLLLAPVRDRLEASHLIIVPHDVLHGLPFHALHDGRRFVVDDFTTSYSPSATVYRLCRAKPLRNDGGALVMGVPDELAPMISHEIDAVASVLPGARVFFGPEATRERLRVHGAACRIVHLATHGRFRRDNPMFSSIRLGDGPLGVYDLYQLALAADLVTLSGCSTGRTAVVGGDELLGLIRGLLYAGARAVLLTLWDAHDRSAADFMMAFYTRLRSGNGQADAVRHAMREIREKHAHPFFWAPYTLVGDVQPAGLQN